MDTVSPGWVLAMIKIAYLVFLFFWAAVDLSIIEMKGIYNPARDSPILSIQIRGFYFNSSK